MSLRQCLVAALELSAAELECKRGTSEDGWVIREKGGGGGRSEGCGGGGGQG